MADKDIYTAAELSRRTKINAVTISAYLREERNPPLDKCEIMGRALGFHGRWLFDGSGPIRLAENGSDVSPDRVWAVPLIDEVTAGKLASPSSQIPEEGRKIVWVAGLPKSEYFALKVNGNSMDRLSPEGSIVVVDRHDRKLINGCAYIFSIAGDTTYKLWQDGDVPFLQPFSTDPTHKPIILKRKRDLDVVGRVRRTILDL
jgi:SOS-response transcriptional repressor LexA